VNYNEGLNQIKVIAKKGKETVIDELTQNYQTAKWGKPAQLILEKIAETNGEITIQVKVLDANNVLCLDAKEYVNFSLTGDGKLMDNRGTSSGSRKVQFYNGRATISLKTNGGKSVVSAKADGISTVFLNL
jgi:beta-galactosidase